MKKDGLRARGRAVPKLKSECEAKGGRGQGKRGGFLRLEKKKKAARFLKMSTDKRRKIIDFTQKEVKKPEKVLKGREGGPCDGKLVIKGTPAKNDEERGGRSGRGKKIARADDRPHL